MAREERELPLFPLGAVVLFPGMPLPLRVFEERYKLMVSDIQKSDSSFGVVLIKEGREVGEPATPHGVGTVARIAELNPAGGGLIHLTAVGNRRFRTLETLRQRPYILARVELLDAEEGAQVAVELIQGVRQAFQGYVRALIGLQGGWTGDVEMPSDPASLSYLVGGALQVEPLVKQRLLEAPTASERLESELDLLRQATAQIKERLPKEGPLGRFSQN